MEVSEANDPGVMSEDQLRAEVWFWRTRAADELQRLHRRIAVGFVAQEHVADLSSRASVWAGLLEGAMTGDDVDKCPLCSEVLVPGQAALREVEEGEVHAECLGTPIGDGQAGDRFQLDPESVVDADDEPDPDSDGVLVSHAYAPAKTTAEIAGIVAAFRRREG